MIEQPAFSDTTKDTEIIYMSKKDLPISFTIWFTIVKTDNVHQCENGARICSTNTGNATQAWEEEILPFTLWVDLDGMGISDISQEQTDKYCGISLICGLWISQSCRNREEKGFISGEMGREEMGFVKRYTFPVGLEGWVLMIYLLCVLTPLCETRHFKIANVSLMCLLPRNWCLGGVLRVLISLTGSFYNVPVSQNCSSFIYRKHIVGWTRKQSRGEEMNSCMNLSTSRREWRSGEC